MLHTARRTSHGASRLVRATPVPAWSVKPQHAPSQGSSDATVFGIRLWLCTTGIALSPPLLLSGTVTRLQKSTIFPDLGIEEFILSS